MKHKIFIFIALIAWIGCQDELHKDFALSVDTDGIDKIGDTIVVKKSEAIDFFIKGNPDVITFYSGEIGHEYAKHDLAESSVEDFISSELTFSSSARFGVIPGTLRVFLSKDFEGLSKNNKKQDSILVENHNWIEITEACKLPTANAQVSSTRIPISEYIGSPVTFAFLYETNQNASPQPAWEIRGLQIENTMKVGNSKNSILAARMNFTPLDMYSEESDTYTPNSETAGKWFLNNINNATNPLMKIQVSPIDSPINKDWLISEPVKLNAREYDRGTAIKNITGYVDKYSYTYNNTGTYVVTFVGKKVNFETSKQSVKHIFIKVIE